jgi:hypothetical protein
MTALINVRTGTGRCSRGDYQSDKTFFLFIPYMLSALLCCPLAEKDIKLVKEIRTF